ncbi:putative mannitol dehydrogenase [Trifolium repens]|nr:putative mannitol dehydrogenase [Trifolium repens]
MTYTLSNEKEVLAFGWAARDSSGILSPYHFSRRENGNLDITMKILYCGICHGDVHFAKNELGRHNNYPMVPGHEIVGEVIKIGPSVKKFKIGDIAGVGPICGSCGTCSGASITPPVLPYMPLMLGRKIIAGSAGGGMKESQDMINFAAKHNITADIEVIPMDYVNTAFERLAKNDVKYRFVIDVRFIELEDSS